VTFRIGQLVELAAGYWIDRSGSVGAMMRGGSYDTPYRGEVIGTSVRSVIIFWPHLGASMPYALPRCETIFLSVSAIDDLANVLGNDDT
jgi:hypothetical protein